MKRPGNRLLHETSPYLLQHAHNPVNWYPWGEEALETARKENKPILVSIGYSACHWCHVMERESFEDEETAALMNQHFVNIKIDREERPDLDHIYMDAVQAMTGSGGWPLNVFLTPEGKPFYGGTYFPPQRAFNRASWKEVLGGVAHSFAEKREEIETQAENLTAHLVQSNSFGLQATGNGLPGIEAPGKIAATIMTNADREWGGFGRAPKFPQTFTIQFLLRYFHTSAKKSTDLPGKESDREYLSQALLSLDKMIEGGIYDQVGGGFARYSTDTEWLVPHFEKMLYDNALLLSVLAEAYQLTGKPRYREVIDETMAFITRELMGSDKGFLSALDADSEGVEGKFYVWDRDEVEGILGEDATLFCEYFDITARGNWEGKNIPRVSKSIDAFAAEKQLPAAVVREVMARGRLLLLERRNGRVRPSLDDKVILGWNALMNTAASKVFGATGEERYRELAVANMQFLFEKFQRSSSAELYHTWKGNEAKYPAFLDDYAFLVQALIHLQEITGDTDWLLKAEKVTQYIIDEFSEEQTGFFFFTGRGQADIIVRKKEVYDGAVPSGNAVMAYNLYQLSILFDRPAWRQRSLDMVSTLHPAAVKYPTSFGVWACLLMEILRGTNEIAIVGKDPEIVLKEVLSEYIPHRILMTGKRDSEWPLLTGKRLGDKTAIWLCKDYTCKLPVQAVPELRTLINSAEAGN